MSRDARVASTWYLAARTAKFRWTSRVSACARVNCFGTAFAAACAGASIGCSRINAMNMDKYTYLVISTPLVGSLDNGDLIGELERAARAFGERRKGEQTVETVWSLVQFLDETKW